MNTTSPRPPAAAGDHEAPDEAIPADEEPAAPRTGVLYLAMALAVLLIVEAGSYAALWLAPRVGGGPIRRSGAIYREHSSQARLLAAPDSSRRTVIDAELGWHYRPGFASGGDAINSQGLRSLREYAPVPAADVVRVAVFGDSFVYGTEVDTKEAWPSQIEALAPRTEVLNYGVGGYGVDQALLRYRREGMRLSPQVVAMGFTPDDLWRLTNVYRPFLSDDEAPLAKPRFELGAGGGLTLLPPPLRDSADYARLSDDPGAARAFGGHDQWYTPAVHANPLYDVSATVRLLSALGARVYHRSLEADRLLHGHQFNPGSTAFRLQLALFQEFAADVERSGARPVIVLLPDRLCVQQALRGEPTVLAPLVDSLRARGLEFVDPTAAFVAAASGCPDCDVKGWFRSGGHYSPAANTIVARALAEPLRQRALPAAAAPRAP